MQHNKLRLSISIILLSKNGRDLRLGEHMMSDVHDERVVHLLWTGGWDSTFRLLTLLLEKRKRTQPYYIIDPLRRSLRMEILAMHRIKEMLFRDHADAINNLLPTIFVEVGDIPPDRKISECYQGICAEHKIGCQYDWLSRFAYHRGIKDLEIGYEKTIDIADDWIAPYMIRYVRAEDIFFKVDIKHKGTNIFEVFKNFKFPLEGLTKLDMQIISIDKGFAEIMNLTWFCHRPLRNGKPCGVCSPCEQSIKNGNSWRLPFTSRFKYFLYKPLKNGKQLLQNKCPKAHRGAQWVKHMLFQKSASR